MKYLFKIRYISLYLLFFLLFFSSVFFIYYLYNFPDPPEVDHLLEYYPEDFLLKIGYGLRLPESRIQYFLNFPLSKKKGSIRIGAFGDSHTFGTEADKMASYPHYLQQLLNKKFPNKNTEVLNFGMAGSGFQEQFLLWEKYFKSYNLDYILLGPRGFYPNRDITFRINWRFQKFRYPRERFILSGENKLKQIHIKGKTLKERYHNYYKIIPTWTALRYDKRPFKIWEWFFPFLRYNINPFYYKEMSDQEESTRINIPLLKKMRKFHDKKMLFFTVHDLSFNNYQLAENFYNLNYIQFNTTNCFYRIFNHGSSLYNESVANIYFNALLGKKNFPLKRINCYFKKVNFIGNKLKQKLYQMKSIQVTDGEGNSIADFRHNASVHYYNKGSYMDRKEKRTKSFISFSNNVDFLDFPFFSLPIQLKEGIKISIRLPNRKKVDLGEIRTLDQSEKFFVFYADFIFKKEYRSRYYESLFLLAQMPSFLKKQIKKYNKSLELFIGEYKLGALHFYKFNGKRSLRFIPVNGYEKSFLMMGPSHSVRERDFPSEFPVYIQYNLNDRESIKNLIPDWRCKKEKKLIHLKLLHFDPL